MPTGDAVSEDGTKKRRKRRRQRLVEGAVPIHRNGRRSRSAPRGELAGHTADGRALVLATTPEPKADIAAQLRALADPANSKDAVFLAPGTALPTRLPRGAVAIRRPEGVLITTDLAKAAFLRSRPHVTTGDMARLLDFPQSKTDALARAQRGEALHAVQARDRRGHVVAEAMASDAGLNATRAAIGRQAPRGGRLIELSPIDAQIRRMAHRSRGRGMRT